MWDSGGRIGLLQSVSVGAGHLGAGLSGFYVRFNTDNINNLNGASFELGGGVSTPTGIAVGLGYDFSVSLTGPSFTGHIFSAGASISPIPLFEAHAQFTTSTVTSDGLKILLRLILGAPMLVYDAIFGMVG